MPQVRTVGLLVGVFIAASLACADALAQDRAACLQAASSGQTLRDAHKLAEARDQFRVCAGALCPSIVQTQCVTWLADVERALPTIVVTAKDGAGADLFDVRVSVDGAPLTTKLDGAAVPLNPGPHAFHLELADGTSADKQVMVREGEKDQSVAVVLKPAGALEAPQVQPPSAPATALLPAPPPADATSRGLGGLRIAALVVGGAGVVGVGVGSYFGLVAMSKKRDSDAQCPGGATGPCSGSGVSSSKDAESAGNASTIAFAVGLAALAGGAVLWFVAPSSPRTAGVSVGAGLAAGGPTVSLGGRF
jgi:hypothetical protein